MNTKEFNSGLTGFGSTRPAQARVLLEVDIAGELHIRSTREAAETIELLDKAMEMIDGQRVPPEVPQS